MSTEMFTQPGSASSAQDKSSNSATESVSQNIEAILAFYTREEQKINRSQRIVESVGGFVGRPLFLVSILLFVPLWALANVLARRVGLVEFDPPPFSWLQGVLTLCALVTTTVVLIRQNRLAKLEEQRAHLDLQVNLLTEQKTTKLIQLIEELRRDLPMVKDRLDPEAEAMTLHTDPHQVLAAMNEMREADAQVNSVEEK
jgi:uncharacterized membrane protein